MLERLVIKNLAIVSGTEIEFGSGLNVLTGETGAGKSIIVDAFMLLMGGKYDRTMLSYGADSGFVEGTFSFVGERAFEILKSYGLDEDGGTVIVKRKFGADGRNDIKVNGSSFTATMLRGLMGGLADLCGQNEYQILTKKREHLKLLDGYAGEELKRKAEAYSSLYSELGEINGKLDIIGDAAERAVRLDILKYQIDEIEKADIGEEEEDELLQLRATAQHYEKIKINLENAGEALEGEDGALKGLSEALRALYALKNLPGEYSALAQRAESAEIEVSDIAASVGTLLRNMEGSEADLDSIENRLAVIRKIKSKYGPCSGLKEKLAKLKKEYGYLANADEEYEDLMADKERVLSELYSEAMDMSAIRKEKAKFFEEDVLQELNELGFKNARFSVEFGRTPEPEEAEDSLGPNGFDEAEFYLSPNAGQPLLPLVKIISGGEMSRFMLALKVISSRYADTETIIFDEIDTGISGRTGLEVAKKLAKISSSTQVLCVTHLPQIAAMADSQYYIEKHSDGEKTETAVSPLDADGMIREISRLSGTGGVSTLADENAKELKSWADAYKRAL